MLVIMSMHYAILPSKEKKVFICNIIKNRKKILYLNYVISNLSTDIYFKILPKGYILNIHTCIPYFYYLLILGCSKKENDGWGHHVFA